MGSGWGRVLGSWALNVVLLIGLFFFLLYAAGALGFFDDPAGTRVVDAVVAVAVLGVMALARWALTRLPARR